jgi:hypothetical protein
MAGFPMPDFGSIGSAIGDFAAASADLGMQQGYYQSARKYTQAGNMEAANARISRASGEIQKLQEARELYKVNSATVAAAGGAGLSTAGSMRDILRSSTSQGMLRQALTAAQEQTDINSHNAQSTAYYAEADQATLQGNAAGAKSGADTMAGITGIMGAVGSMAMMAFL